MMRYVWGCKRGLKFTYDPEVQTHKKSGLRHVLGSDLLMGLDLEPNLGSD